MLGLRQKIFEMGALVIREEPRAPMLNRCIRSRNPGKQTELVAWVKLQQVARLKRLVPKKGKTVSREQ